MEEWRECKDRVERMRSALRVRYPDSYLCVAVVTRRWAVAKIALDPSGGHDAAERAFVEKYGQPTGPTLFLGLRL